MSHAAQDDPTYVELVARLNGVVAVGGASMSALWVVTLWGQWRLLSVVAGLSVGLVAFNAGLVNAFLLRRWGIERAEYFRNIVNLGVMLYADHVTHWPLVAWLQLPFIALVYDHLDARLARNVLAVTCVAETAVALADRVSWTVPLSFVALAAFASKMSDVRFAAIRRMLREAEQQRRSIDAAHDDLKREVRARMLAERELRQAQKLEAIGRLASGVAHEMNTPVQFVSDSVTFIRAAVGDVLRVVAAYEAGAPNAEIAALAREVDLEFVRTELPNAVGLASKGLERVATIVRSMRQLAHPDHAEMVPVDVNEVVRSVVVMSASEHHLVADVTTELSDLPPVVCHEGEIAQVLLNLVVNAAQAIGGGPGRGRIRIRTKRDRDDVVVSVEDSGPGIPPEVRERVFEPFFTTKPVGRGTGQGLAIARSIVLAHRGSLTFESSPAGTTFHVRVPVAGGAARAA